MEHAKIDDFLRILQPKQLRMQWQWQWQAIISSTNIAAVTAAAAAGWFVQDMVWSIMVIKGLMQG